MNNIILCGFMGSGKTTIGRAIARISGMEFLDTDTEIERESGMAIPEIFSRYGEDAFRDLEHETIAALRRRIRCVVSTGGGALTYPRNIAQLDHAHDLVVFLGVPFGTCYARIRDTDRPIVRRSTPEELRALFEKRRTSYLAAARLATPAAGTAEQTAQEILEAFEKQRAASPLKTS